MDNNKLLQEIFKDDEKFEIYLNGFFLKPPRPKDVFLDSTNVDFLTKYRKDGWENVTKRAIEVLYHSCYEKFGDDVRTIPKLSIEGDRTKITLEVYKDKDSVNQSEILHCGKPIASIVEEKHTLNEQKKLYLERIDESFKTN
jgi:hypothetical protein